MAELRRLRPPKRWPWVLAILLAIAVDALLIGSRTGECVDYTAESGAVSTCISGPAFGREGTWLLAAVSVLVVSYFGGRLVRAARRQ